MGLKFNLMATCALVCMWSATILLIAMFFMRNMEWIEEVNVFAYLGYLFVVGMAVATILRR